MLLAATTDYVWAASSVDWEFESDDLKVVVIGKDAVYDDVRSYQIVVSDELRTIARLEVNRDGLVTDAWLTDLDQDGMFEVVVATGQLSGAEAGAVDVHEWQEFRFVSSRPKQLTTTELVGYQGNDQYTIAGGRLQRSYPMFNETDGMWVPTGLMARFEYQYPEDRWEARGPK
tara:strand:+ start:861 stop:1379 length:519 start_codon:yes stop_codon:yes gene_type:complete